MASDLRHLQWQDYALIGLQTCLRTLSRSTHPTTRQSPAEKIMKDELSANEKQLSARLMRINHTGEVCAQALYFGQSFTTRSSQLREVFQVAAQEEIDHLQWCQERIIELNSHTSYLNPLWFSGSLFIGTLAGLMGDRWSLGFLAETEEQVSAHLNSHLEKLSLQDLKSRAIVSQMQQDEAKHATTAIYYGGKTLPLPIQVGMQLMAKVMTTIVYYV